MKKVLVVAAALSIAGGAASAGTYGLFSSYGGWSSSSKGYISSNRGKSSKRWNRGSIIKVVKPNRPGKCSVLWCGSKPPMRKPNDGDKPSDVPVPAAGFLLLAGLGGLAAVKRRNKA